MAERRMFAKSIIDSDAFLDMPTSAQCLYFHMAMRADDEGFVNAPRKIMRMVGAADDDARLLVAKKFIIPFDSGVVVIKHWRIHNYLRSDRFKPTNYRDERAALSVKSNGAYTLDSGEADSDPVGDVSELDTDGIPTVYQTDTQYRIGKDSLGKDSIGESDKGRTAPRFVPPAHEDVEQFCTENGINIDVDAFFDHYTANGWKAGRVPMKDWRAAARNWYRRDQSEQKPAKRGPAIKSPYDNIPLPPKKDGEDDLERLAIMMGVDI